LGLLTGRRRKLQGSAFDFSSRWRPAPSSLTGRWAGRAVAADHVEATRDARQRARRRWCQVVFSRTARGFSTVDMEPIPQASPSLGLQMRAAHVLPPFVRRPRSTPVAALHMRPRLLRVGRSRPRCPPFGSGATSRSLLATSVLAGAGLSVRLRLAFVDALRHPLPLPRSPSAHVILNMSSVCALTGLRGVLACALVPDRAAHRLRSSTLPEHSSRRTSSSGGCTVGTQ